MRPVTPRGFRDVLPQEAAERRALSSAFVATAEAWGYGLVETPVAEEYDTLEAGAGRAVGGETFRLFDLDGSLLALRPEMTVPIARLAASRFAAEDGPHRLAYVAPVFREHASLRGQSRQFTQVGVEFVGASGPAADAEVVAVLVESLRACGLEAFSVGVGTVAVLQGLLGASEMPDAWREAVLRAAHERNLVELDRLAAERALTPELRDALRAVPRLRGGRESIDACRGYARACGCEDALDALAETWRLLEAAGVADVVAVDFGILRSFDYYTGLILEVYAPGLGLPLGGGGRYDGLLGEFESPAPAAGFALTLERVHIALAERGMSPDVAPLDVLLGAEDAAAAFVAARALRARGLRVRLALGVARDTLDAEAARLGAGEAMWAEAGGVGPASDAGADAWIAAGAWIADDGEPADGADPADGGAR